MHSAEEAIKEISLLIKSRIPIQYVVSPDEEKAVSSIKELCDKEGRKMFEWTATDGLIIDHKVASPLKDSSYVVETILADMRKDIKTSTHNKVVYVLKDFHSSMGFHNERKLKDIIVEGRNSYRNIIILAPILQMPETLHKDIPVVDFPLPSADDIKAILQEFETEHKIGVKDEEGLVNALKGLTTYQIYNALSKALVRDKVINNDTIGKLYQEKTQNIKRNGLLEVMTTEYKLDQIGGLQNLKQWFKDRKEVLTHKAKEYNLPACKGVLLLGVPGCGKSLIAKSLGDYWKVPVLKLEMGSVFGGIVGQSESQMRSVIKTAEALSPCILYIDEIEKGFSGTASSNYSDAGTCSRVFQTFLTWMQDRSVPVFVVATANDLSQLHYHHPEFLRAGRWDAKFFVDLPNKDEREQIWSIHITQRGRKPDLYEIEKLSMLSEGFTGAEIEQAIKDAMFAGFARGSEFTQADLEASIEAIMPMSEVSPDKIAEIKMKAKEIGIMSAGTGKIDKSHYNKIGFIGKTDFSQNPEWN